VAQTVERLLCQCKVLSSNTHPTQKGKKERKKRKEGRKEERKKEKREQESRDYGF
jgi:hypothetical protein